MAKPKPTTPAFPPAPTEPAGPPTVEEVLSAHTPDPLEEAKREAQALGSTDEAPTPAPPPTEAPPAAPDAEDTGEPPPVAEPPKPLPRWLVESEGRVNFGSASTIMRVGKVLSHEWADRIDVIREHGIQLRELPPE